MVEVSPRQGEAGRGKGTPGPHVAPPRKAVIPASQDQSDNVYFSYWARYHLRLQRMVVIMC